MSKQLLLSKYNLLNPKVGNTSAATITEEDEMMDVEGSYFTWS